MTSFDDVLRCQAECFSAVFHCFKCEKHLLLLARNRVERHRNISFLVFVSLFSWSNTCCFPSFSDLLASCNLTFIKISGNVCSFFMWSPATVFVSDSRELKAIKFNASRQSVQQIMWLSSHDKNVHNVNAWLRWIWNIHLWVNHDNFQSTMKGKLCKTFHREVFFITKIVLKNCSYMGCVQSSLVGLSCMTLHCNTIGL